MPTQTFALAPNLVMAYRSAVAALLSLFLAVPAIGAQQSRPAPTAASLPKGSVVGRILACSGLGYAKAEYVGGTVLALRGKVRSVPLSPTTGKLVFPTDVVARQRVPAGEQFHFSLSPGQYVIELPRYSGGNFGTWASVTVHGGTTVHVVLPNMCA